MFSNRLRWLVAGMALAVASCAYGQAGYGYGYGQPDYRDYRDYRNDGYALIRCESQDERTRYCPADIRGDVRLVNQLSRSSCVEGRSWGWDRRGIWVSRGCRADFRIEDRYGYDDGRYPGNSDYGRGRVIRCESVNSRTVYCNADTRDGVRLLTQHSRAACIEGRTWGWNSRGVWVSEGCRAQFQIGGRGYDDDRYGYEDRYGDNYTRRVTCQSHDGRYNFCRIDGHVRQVQIHRQLSQSQCHYNYSWGYRSDGIWVDRGCRAEFVLY